MRVHGVEDGSAGAGTGGTGAAGAGAVAGSGSPGRAAARAPGACRSPAPARWVWLAAWPVTAVFVLSNAATPLYVRWQRDMGFSKGTLTLVFAFYILGLLGSLLVSGAAADRLGRRPVLVPALLLAMVSCAVFASAANVVALIVARLLAGIAVGAVVSAGMAAVTDVAGPGRRAFGALLASCAMVLGAGLGPFLAGLLSETAPGPTVTVFVVEAVLLSTALVVAWRMPLAGRPAGSSGPGAGDGPGPGDGPGAPGGAGGAVRGRRAGALRVPRVPRGHGLRLALGIAVFAPGLTATSFVLSLGPSLLSGLLGTDSGLLASSVALVMFLTAAGAQFSVRRLGRRTVLLLSATGTALAMVALACAVATSSVGAFAAAAVLAGAGQGLGQLSGLTLLSTAVAPARLAEANAALNVGAYVPAGLLPVAAGFLSDAAGLTAGTTVFATVLLSFAAAGALLVAVRGRAVTGLREA